MGKWLVGIFIGAILVISISFAIQLKEIGQDRAQVRQTISEKIELQGKPTP